MGFVAAIRGERQYHVVKCGHICKKDCHYKPPTIPSSLELSWTSLLRGSPTDLTHPARGAKADPCFEEMPSSQILCSAHTNDCQLQPNLGAHP